MSTAVHFCVTLEVGLTKSSGFLPVLSIKVAPIAVISTCRVKISISTQRSRHVEVYTEFNSKNLKESIYYSSNARGKSCMMDRSYISLG